MISKKELAILLSKVKFSKEKDVDLEQYDTPSELAADLVWQAYMAGSIEERVVADLGCGSGILGIGALLMGAKKVYFLDLDYNAIKLAESNCKIMGVKGGEFICGDVSTFDSEVDTVIMNPPFGVQNRKADKIFLQIAMKISKSIFSMHKIQSRKFIQQISSENGFVVENLREVEFRIPKTYHFHKQDKRMIKIGIWNLIKRKIF